MSRSPDVTALLVEPTNGVTLVTLDEIARALLTFSDRVYVHSAVRVAPLGGPTESHVRSTVADLADAGLVQYFALESDSAEEIRSADRVISEADHLDLYNAIVGRVQSGTTHYRDHLSDPERTSRIVEQRNELWRFGLATLLDAELSRGIPQSSPIQVEHELRSLSINAELASELFHSVGVRSLAHLTVDDILIHRKEGKKFRKEFNLLALEAENEPDSGARVVAAREHEKYMKQLTEIARETTGNGAVKNLVEKSAVNVLGVFFSSIAAISATADLIDFFRNRSRLQFLLYLQSTDQHVDGLERLR